MEDLEDTLDRLCEYVMSLDEYNDVYQLTHDFEAYYMAEQYVYLNDVLDAVSDVIITMRDLKAPLGEDDKRAEIAYVFRWSLRYLYNVLPSREEVIAQDNTAEQLESNNCDEQGDADKSGDGYVDGRFREEELVVINNREDLEDAKIRMFRYVMSLDNYVNVKKLTRQFVEKCMANWNTLYDIYAAVKHAILAARCLVTGIYTERPLDEQERGQRVWHYIDFGFPYRGNDLSDHYRGSDGFISASQMNKTSGQLWLDNMKRNPYKPEFW